MTKNELISAVERHLKKIAFVEHQTGSATMRFDELGISLLLGARGDGGWYVTDIERHAGADRQIDLTGIPTLEHAAIQS